jgi:hypothetical protein
MQSLGIFKVLSSKCSERKFNWDQQLFQKIDELENINNKDQLNEFYSNWIESLEKLKFVKIV